MPIWNYFYCLSRFIKGLYRRDDIFMVGEFEGQKLAQQVTMLDNLRKIGLVLLQQKNCLTYVMVNSRIENSQAVESYIYLDIPEL